MSRLKHKVKKTTGDVAGVAEKSKKQTSEPVKIDPCQERATAPSRLPVTT